MTAGHGNSEGLLAEWAIRSTLDRYFSSVDRHDWPTLRTCFTENAKGEYDARGQVLLDGRDAIVDQIAQWMEGITSTHTFSNAHIAVNGSTASAETRTVAHLVVGRDPERRILVRGVTYFDELVLSPQGVWEISHRIHVAVWQHEAEALSPAF